MSEPLPNPFSNDVVTEVRGIEAPIRGLNDKPLDYLLSQFITLRNNQKSRQNQPVKVPLIVSPEPGYGKSHLIGRLFKKLSGKANLVFVRPFEDPSSAWRSIQLSLINELSFPERVGVNVCQENEPSQLEVLAHGVLRTLAATVLPNYKKLTKTQKEQILNALKESNVTEFRKKTSHVKWIYQMMAGMQKVLTQLLTSLHAGGGTWLKFLRFVAYDPQRFVLRDACMDWLKGGSIDREEAQTIGIRLADIPHYDATVEQNNEICRGRLIDLCKLTGLYRPFVFCFDQTENYGKNEELAKALGIVVETLFSTAPNQMTILTANQSPWQDSVVRHWEVAHQHRLAPAQVLEGMTMGQARDLIEQRLMSFGQGGAQKKMIDSAWLNPFFAKNPRSGVRAFLQACGRRWESEDEFPPVEPSRTVPSGPSLEELFQQNIRKIESDPKQRVNQIDALLWFTREVAGGFPGLTVTTPGKRNTYFEVIWNTENKALWLGFESGSHWKRWETIAKEAARIHRADSSHRAAIIRTAGLPKIPKASWKKGAEKLREAMSSCFRIYQLSEDQMVVIYAARNLYLDAESGNIEYSPKETMAFVKETLRPVLKSVWGGRAGNGNGAGDEPGEKPPDELIKQVRRIVAKKKFLSFDELMADLSGKYSKHMVQRAQACIPEIKVHVSIKATVLQWQSNPSV